MQMRAPLFAVLFIGSVGVDAQDLNPSLIQLIATPERYDGKVVQVTGYCNLEFEGNALYLHQDDQRYGNTKNGIWLHVDEKIKRNPTLRKTHCIVRGVFSSKNHGHMGLFSGELSNIERYDTWPPTMPKQKP